MDTFVEPQQVVKGGVCWFEIGGERTRGGLKIYVKADPRVEDFVKTLGNGRKDSIEVYGRSWIPVAPSKVIEVYQMEKNLMSDSYTLSAPAETFKAPSCGRVNLSFLRIVGVSDGLQFGMMGPYSKPYIRESFSDITREVRSLVRDYIAPIHINFRISSQEV